MSSFGGRGGVIAVDGNGCLEEKERREEGRAGGGEAGEGGHKLY